MKVSEDVHEVVAREEVVEAAALVGRVAGLTAVLRARGGGGGQTGLTLEWDEARISRSNGRRGHGATAESYAPLKGAFPFLSARG